MSITSAAPNTDSVSTMQSAGRDQWSSRMGFLLAAVGSAVGLANIWRFPYAAGSGGGGAFVFVYLVATFSIVLPVLIAELLVGRRGQLSPPNAIARVAREAGVSSHWRWMGLAGVLAAILIFSFYIVVGGWTLSYVVKSASGDMHGLEPVAIAATFDGLNANAWELFAWASAFLLLTVSVSARGISGGIEKLVRLLMPLLFLMLLGMVVYAGVIGDFRGAWKFLFTVDFSKLNSKVVMDAIGQAFFSIGVGITNLMAYGSYLDRRASIPRSSVAIVSADTAVALIAGMAIFPIIFASGMSPSGGPGLVFMALPQAFGQMPAGALVGGLFFLLLFFAALTSAVSMMECSVAWLSEKLNTSRARAALLSGGLSWGLGILSVLSFNGLADFHPLGFIPALEGKTFFDLFDYLVSNLIMPLCAILVALFVGWRLPVWLTQDELDGPGPVNQSPGASYRCWQFLLRYVTPVGLVAVFIVAITS